MDSFFAKKGLTLSRNGNHNKAARQQLLRSQEITLCPPPPPPANNSTHIQTLHKQLPEHPKMPHVHLALYPSNRDEKSLSIEHHPRLTAQREAESQPTNHSQWKFSLAPTPPKPRQNSLNSSRQEQRADSSKLSIIEVPTHSFESHFSHQRQSSSQRLDALSEIKHVGKLKMTLEAHRMETESAKPYGRYFENSPVRSIEKTEVKLRGISPENTWKRAQRDGGMHVSQQWFDQKLSLLKELNEKTSTIRELQTKMAQTERELNSRISNLQLQVRILQQSKNRLQTERQTIQTKMQQQRLKHQKAQQDMNRLIFFEEDLIHAKDYNRLKQELHSVYTENAIMFQEHQQYIISVAEGRRAMAKRLEEVENDMNVLRQEYKRQRQKLQALSNNADDKLQLIKLQNDLNFLKKKSQQFTEVIISKERQLQQAKMTLKNLTEQHNLRNDTSQKFMQENNMQQIKETITAYEARVNGLAAELADKTSEVEKLKRDLESLAGEVRAGKEERHINSMKQRSSENSLRNEVETLQRALQGHQDIAAKRTAALQDSLQRKTKEISQKDAFIKNFLLTRSKQIESSDAQTILQTIHQYFSLGVQ